MATRPIAWYAAVLCTLVALAPHARAACGPGNYSPDNQVTCIPVRRLASSDRAPPHVYLPSARRVPGKIVRRSSWCLPSRHADECPAESGASTCKDAQAGWFAAGPGATAQSPCLQGTFSTGLAAACTICPAGSHCNGNTNTAPQLCEPGRFSASPGAGQDCDLCPPGTFTAARGSTSCCPWCVRSCLRRIPLAHRIFLRQLFRMVYGEQYVRVALGASPDRHSTRTNLGRRIASTVRIVATSSRVGPPSARAAQGNASPPPEPCPAAANREASVVRTVFLLPHST